MSLIAKAGARPTGASLTGGGLEGFQSLESFGKPFGSSRTQTPEQLLELARLQGGAVAQTAEELVHPETSILSTVGAGLRNAFVGFIDIISTPSKVVAGAISPDHTIGEAIERDLRPSDVIFGGLEPNTSAMEKVGAFTVRLAVDILTDPLTYVTFGASSGALFGARAIQKVPILTAEGKQITRALSKEGVEVSQFLKKVERQKNGLYSALQYGDDATKANLPERLTLFKELKSLQKQLPLTAEQLQFSKSELNQLLGKSLNSPLRREFANDAMSKLLQKFPQLSETLLDKGGIKFFGKSLLSGQRISDTVSLIPGMTILDKLTRNSRLAFQALFDPSIQKVEGRFQRLPPEFVEFQRRAFDLAESMKDDRIKNISQIIKANSLSGPEGKFLMAAVEAGKLPRDPRLAKAFKQLTGFNERELTLLRQAGVHISRLDNHAPHILVKGDVTNVPFKLPPSSKVGAAQKRKLEGSIFDNTSSALDEFEEAVLSKNSARIEDTISKLKNDGFEIFDDNLISASVSRSIDNVRAVTMRHFINDVAENFGMTVDKAHPKWVGLNLNAFKKEEEFLIKMGLENQRLRFHPAIAKRLEEFIGSAYSDDASREFWVAYDEIQDMWKASVTSIFPAFHGRNAISNVFLNYNDIGLEVLNPKTNAMGAQIFQMDFRFNELNQLILKGGDDAVKATEDLTELMGREMFTDTSGFKWTFGELRSVIRENNIALRDNIVGILDVQRTPDEMIQAIMPHSVRDMVRGGKFSPLSRNFTPFEWGRKVANYVEGQARLINFLTNLRKTGDVGLATARTKQFTFDYQYLTAFEKNVMRRIFPFYCVPEDSEILTKEGWKYYDELKIGEIVLTLNKDTLRHEWQPLKEVAIFNHDEPLMTYSDHSYKIRFTPNHRWIVKNHKGQTVVKEGRELNKGDSIITSAKIEESNSILTPEQARLLGWLLTDGYYHWRGNHCEAFIYQHPNRFLEEVKEVAGGTPRKPHPESGIIAVPVKKERIEEIKHLLIRDKKKDNWVDVVTNLSTEAAEAMYDAMYKANGNTKEDTQGYFASTLKGVADTFEVLSTMLGYRVRKSGDRGYYISNYQTLDIKSDNQGGSLAWEHYSGKVWCPKTENGTWVMKQNGLITVSGNTFTRKNLEVQVKTLLTAPGRTEAQITTLTTLSDVLAGAQLTKEERDALPDWLKGSINILKKRKGSDVEIFGSLQTPIEQPFQQFQSNQLLAAISPLPRIPAELATGYSFFHGKPLNEVTNAAAFQSAPSVIKDFIGYSKIEGTRKDGSSFTWHVSLRPDRMHVLLNMPPTSRVLSALKQVQTQDVSTGSKILQQVIGLRPFQFDLEREAGRREKELADRLEDLLTNAGVGFKFERFIPSD